MKPDPSGSSRSRARFPGARLAMPVLVAVLVASCEHPIAVVSAHVEAADILIADTAGVILARTEYNRSWNIDALLLTEEQSLAVVPTVLDFRGNVIDLRRRPDISIRMEARDGSLLQWEPLKDRAILHPFAEGSTDVRFLIWHINHADFVTPWLRVTVGALPVSGR